MTYREAAIKLLRERGPMHYKDLCDAIVESHLVQARGATPAATLNATITIDIKRNGTKSEFVRVRPGVIGLRAAHATAIVSDVRPEDTASGVDTQSTVQEIQDSTEHRVRIPFLPPYREVRQIIKVWVGRPPKQITGLQATLAELRGTPQNTMDWTRPDEWIVQLLKNGDKELAQAIWIGSGKTINPRHTYGHWLLAKNYRLIREGDRGTLVLTERGHDFLEQLSGDTEVYLDEQEGLTKLLAQVADKGPTRSSGLLEKWTEFLAEYSAFAANSTIRETLRLRLNNLLDRKLIVREGPLYSITDDGLTYLRRNGGEEDIGDEQEQIRNLIGKQRTAVRETLRDLLQEMDPFAFEHLIKRLLQEMDYQNVEVTIRSGDGGVDVVADIELGISSVREVVQAKRHKRTIQRKDLDALRGSLYRFNAVRGTIIATAPFSRGTAAAAFAPGVAPITLIDCEKLIDLLIHHEIGVRKRTIEVLEVDPDGFHASDLEES